MGERWSSGLIFRVGRRSFAETHRDGMEDLPLNTSGCDIAVSPGVDAIWLSPTFTTAQRKTDGDPSGDCGVWVGPQQDGPQEHLKSWTQPAMLAGRVLRDTATLATRTTGRRAFCLRASDTTPAREAT